MGASRPIEAYPGSSPTAAVARVVRINTFTKTH